MPNKLLDCSLLAAGEKIICAVSGGMDSMALLVAMLELAEPMQLQIEAAHFNHQLRGEQSQRDADFVQSFCDAHHVPLHMGSANVQAYAEMHGQSIEQAARELRYAFLQSLACDKIATAHNADDNAETVLLNLIRGTGLHGLCGIPPVRGNIIRPLLKTSRAQIEQFLLQRGIDHVEDATNAEDAALRNRIRHRILPLFKDENPSFLQTTIRMTEHLRKDAKDLDTQLELALSDCKAENGYRVSAILALPDGLRQRVLHRILAEHHVRQVTHRHVACLESLLNAKNPSAKCSLPDNLLAQRQYDLLLLYTPSQLDFAPIALSLGEMDLPQLGLHIVCKSADRLENSQTCFTVVPSGKIILRPRKIGDAITLSGGTKSIKKLMIDRKIPRSLRPLLPVLEDDLGILAVYGIGANEKRIGLERAFTIQIMKSKRTVY